MTGVVRRMSPSSTAASPLLGPLGLVDLAPKLSSRDPARRIVSLRVTATSSSSRIRVSVLVKRVLGSVGLEESVCQEDQPSHDGGEGDLGRLPGIVSCSYWAVMCGLNRAANSAGM